MFSTSYEPTANSKIVLQKLADENYFKWSYEMEMHLRSLGLWKNVCFEAIEEYWKSLDGEEEPQEIKLEPKKKAKSNESPLKLIEAVKPAEKRKWKEDDSKCIATIGLFVAEKFYRKLRECKSAYEAWRILAKEAGGQNNYNKLALKCQFYSIAMEEEEPLLKFVDRVTLITDKLSQIGVATEESEICFKILSALPEEYKPITLSCLMIDQEKLTINFLKQQFALEKTAQLNRKPKNPNEEQSLNTGTNNNRNRNNYNSIKECYRCSKKGHIAKECRIPQWKIDQIKKEANQISANQSADENAEKDVVALNSTAVRPENKNDLWYLDSGCTAHMTNNRSDLSNASKSNAKIFGALQDTSQANVKGNVYLNCRVRNQSKEVKLKNALYVPNLQKKLLSVAELCQEENCQVVFDKKGFSAIKNEEVIMKGKLDQGLYKLEENQEKREEANNVEEKRLWHERLGHLSNENIEKLKKLEMVEDLKIKENSEAFNCPICPLGKHARKPISKEAKEEQIKEIGDRIHTDVCGPITPETAGGYSYFISFIDEYSRKSAIFDEEERSSIRKVQRAEKFAEDAEEYRD